ncbi:hypothetical protein BDFG_09194, partial [Blastomyces dermatitidis ATCC 26199]
LLLHLLSLLILSQLALGSSDRLVSRPGKPPQRPRIPKGLNTERLRRKRTEKLQNYKRDGKGCQCLEITSDQQTTTRFFQSIAAANGNRNIFEILPPELILQVLLFIEE